jgi:GT2 family glycosyltransferase
MGLSVVVLSHNRRSETEHNLPLLLRSLSPLDELILIDNNSTDGTQEAIRRISRENSNVQTALLAENTGVARGRNTGFRLATRDYILALDDDALASEHALRQVPSYFAAYPQAGILAFRVIHAESREAQNDHGPTIVPVANFHGAAHAIRRKALEDAGYLDEKCTFGAEELDLSIRFHAAGYSTLYIPALEAEHNSHIRPGKVGLERRRKWAKNYVRVLFKNFSFSQAMVLASRYLFLSIVWARSAIGISGSVRVAGAGVVGMLEGRLQHKAVPRWTAEFYASPTLRPEFGNAPLELWNRLCRKLRNSPKANH